MDYIAVAEKLPAENTKAPMRRHRMEGGDQGGTAACAIARLGGSATLVGKLGGDEALARMCRRAPVVLLDPEVTYLAPFLNDLGQPRGLLV